ncbi:hypothetical protein HEP86_29715 [Streptomyces sp. RPA4-5]|uniref:hypothetical protein n=1 Tax=Streptomyces sp. P9-2B-2 TaxID=3057114 RepID=UPI00143E1BAB|nr:hypothetical protein [Streptomyces sp. P9-2B-2]QIY57942.1 hypothetical protein HEP86_29715 [Streptomyces sp. RPA4-5]WJY41078.1 hypothetical protein QT196_29490 [Streptomyces sp. P9-2B-2]
MNLKIPVQHPTMPVTMGTAVLGYWFHAAKDLGDNRDPTSPPSLVRTGDGRAARRARGLPQLTSRRTQLPWR